MILRIDIVVASSKPVGAAGGQPRMPEMGM